MITIEKKEFNYYINIDNRTISTRYSSIIDSTIYIKISYNVKIFGEDLYIPDLLGCEEECILQIVRKGETPMNESDDKQIARFEINDLSTIKSMIDEIIETYNNYNKDFMDSISYFQLVIKSIGLTNIDSLSYIEETD